MAAGNSLEQSVALVAAANKVVQDPNSVGSALRTISLRLRGTSVEVLEEMGEETDGVVESFSKMQEKIKALTSVDILTDSGSYKETYQILYEIGQVWEDMSDIDQAALLELMAGKNRANTLAAILSNMADLEGAYESALNAEGSAMRENEAYLDSIQGRIDLFNNAVQTMWMNLISSDTVKGIVDLGTSLVKILDTAHGKIIALVGALTIYERIKNGTKFSDMFAGAVNIVNELAHGVKTLTAETLEQTIATKLNNKELATGIITNAGLAGVTGNLTKVQIQETVATLNQMRANGDLTASQYLAAMSTMGLKTALQGLWTVLKANPIFLVAAAVTALALAFDHFNVTAHEAAEVAKEAFNEIQDVVNSTKSTIQELESELNTIQSRIDELNGKELSFAEDQELEKLKAQREELEHSLKIQQQLLELQQDASNKQAIASMKAYTKAASEGAEETQNNWKKVLTTILAIGGTAVGAFLTGGTSLGIQAAGMVAGGVAGGIAGNKAGEYVGSEIASNEGTYDSWYKTYTKALDAARKDEQKAFEQYQKDSSNIDKLDKWQEAQQRTTEIEAEMYEHLSQMQQYYSGLEYGVSDEIDKELDAWYNFLDKLSIDQGASGSEVTALDRIFGENASEEIQTIKEQIVDAVASGKEFDFDAAINGSQELKDTLDYVGLSAEDVKNYFTQIGEEAAKISTKEVIPVKTYADISEEAENYKEILSQTSEIIVDNTKVTEDYKNSLIALVGSEEKVNKYFDENNKLIVKDANGLNNLVKATNKNVAANASLAKSQARLQYYELFKKMQSYISAEGKVIAGKEKEILALYQEMNALEKTIAKYSRLEAQLLDTANAYSAFEKAQEADSATDYIGSVEDMVSALGDAFNTAKLGTETAQAAITGIVPESVYEDLDTVDEKMAAIYDYFKNGKISQYFNVEYDDNGSIAGVEMNLGNLRKVIEDGLADINGDGISVFSGEDWEHFELNQEWLDSLPEGTDKLQAFADEFNLTKDVAFAFLKAMEDHDAEWLNGDHTSILEQLLPDTLANDIYENTAALADLAVQLANGEITAEEYTQQWNELNKVSQENAQKARENATAWIETSNSVEEAKTKVQKLSNELDTLYQEGASETEIKLKTDELESAKQDLTNLVQKLSELETIDPVVLQLALDQAQAEIDAFEKDNSTLLAKVEIVQDQESGEYTYEVKAGITLDENEKKELESYLEDVNAKHIFENALGEDIVTAEEHLQSIEEILQHIYDRISGKESKTDAVTTPRTVQEIISDVDNTSVVSLKTAIAELSELYNSKTVGNVDYADRPILTSEQMHNAGWSDFPDNEFATTYDQGYVVPNNKEEDYSLVVTPIIKTEDGTEIMSPEELDDYVYNYLAGSANILEADKVENGGKGALINIAEGSWDPSQFEQFNDGLVEIKSKHLELSQTLDMLPDGFIEEVAAFFTRTIPEKWNEFWDGVGSFFNSIGNHANVLKENLGKFFTETVPEKWNEFWSGVGEFLAPFVEQASILKQRVASFFTETVPEKWDEFWVKAAEVWNSVQEWANATKDKVVAFFTETVPEKWGQFWDKAGEVWDNVQAWAGATKDKVVNFFTVTLPQKWSEFWDNVNTFLTESVPYAVGYAAGAVVRFFTEIIPQKWDEFLDAAGDAWGNVKEWASETKDKVIEFFTKTIPDAWDEFWDNVGKFIDQSVRPALKSFANSVKSFFTKTIPQKWDEFWAKAGEILGNVTEWAANTKDAVVSFFTETIPNAWSDFWSSVKTFIDESIIPALQSAASAVKAFFTETIPTAWNSFWVSVGNFIDETVIPALQSVKDKISEFFLTTIPQKWSEFWSAAKTFLTETIPSALSLVKDGITTFFTVTIPSVINGLWDDISAWISAKASAIWDSLKSGFSAGKSGGESGSAGANGTAHAKGTITKGKSHQSGDWGLPTNEHNALVGELGKELVVDAHNGRYYTVGDNGAEMVDLPKDAIIFNHKQTEGLLKNGHINSRGKAYAEGNAHVTIWPDASSKNEWDGTGYSGPDDPTWDAIEALSDTSNDLSDAAEDLSDATDEFREVFDWVEIRLEEIDETLNLLGSKLENAVGINEKNSIIDQMIGLNATKMENLKAGLEEYSIYAAQLLADIPAEFQAAAQDGSIAITEFVGEADEAAVEAINTYREWAQKIADLTQQMEDLNSEVSDLAKQKFDNISEGYDNEISLIEAKMDQIEAYNSYLDTWLGSESYIHYEDLIDETNKQISELEKKRDEMQAELDKQVEAGNIEVGDDEWYEMVTAISEVDTAIIEAKESVLEFQDSINEIHWERFDELISRFESIEKETENLIDILSNEKLVNDDGSWTDEGITTLGLYAQQMENAEMQAQAYQEEIDYLNENWQELGYTEEEYLEKLDELKSAQYDAIDSYHDAKDAIVDLNKERVDAIKNGIEKEIDAYEKLIETKKEELDAEKD